MTTAYAKLDSAYTELLEHHVALRAELQTEHDMRIDTDHKLTQLEAENERLLATLRRAADAPCTHCSAPSFHGQRNTAHFIADQALSQSHD